MIAEEDIIIFYRVLHRRFIFLKYTVRQEIRIHILCHLFKRILISDHEFIEIGHDFGGLILVQFIEQSLAEKILEKEILYFSWKLIFRKIMIIIFVETGKILIKDLIDDRLGLLEKIYRKLFSSLSAYCRILLFVEIFVIYVCSKDILGSQSLSDGKPISLISASGISNVFETIVSHVLQRI